LKQDGKHSKIYIFLCFYRPYKGLKLLFVKHIDLIGVKVFIVPIRG